jgi:hypothetical protein
MLQVLGWVLEAIPGSTLLETMTSNIIRSTNTIFMTFLTLSNIINRVDHAHQVNSQSYLGRFAEAMSGSAENDTALQLFTAEEEDSYEEVKSLDLQYFDIVTATAIRNKVFRLLKVRKDIKKNVTLFNRYHYNPEVDVPCTDDIDENLKGNTSM